MLTRLRGFNQLICHQPPVKADKHLSPVLSRVFDYPNSAVIFKNSSFFIEKYYQSKFN